MDERCGQGPPVGNATKDTPGDTNNQRKSHFGEKIGTDQSLGSSYRRLADPDEVCDEVGVWSVTHPISIDSRGRHARGVVELPLLAGDTSAIYLLVALVVMADALLPLVPSETLLASAGALVAAGELAWAPLLFAGAAGALSGRALLYGLGRWSGGRVRQRLRRLTRGGRRLDSAVADIDRRPWVLVAADFVPWGRTVAMYSAGAGRMRPDRFLIAAGLGAMLWSATFVTVGKLAGEALESTWHGIALSVGLVAVIGVVGETMRRRR